MWGDAMKSSTIVDKKNKRTTVVLTHRSKAIMLRSRTVYGQKSILSVGVELFEDLSLKEREHRIMEAEQSDSFRDAQHALKFWGEIKSLLMGLPEQAYEFLPAELRDALQRVTQVFAAWDGTDKMRVADEIVHTAVQTGQSQRSTQGRRQGNA